MRSRRVILMTAGLLLCIRLAVAGATDVEVIVEPGLYAGGEITYRLNRYLQDIRDQGYTPTLTTTPFADAATLRSHLAGLYTGGGLAGAVLIGDLPAAEFEIPAHDIWYDERFVTDLYLSDLDGTWMDVGWAPGVLDVHFGDVGPEIWVGRLSTSSLVGTHAGRTEAGLLNAYLDKNHAYRTGSLRVRSEALVYVDDDWSDYWPGKWASAGMAVSGQATVVKDPATTSASDYLLRLGQGWEQVVIGVHSAEYFHQFYSEGSPAGHVLSSEIAGEDPPALFYNFFACSAGDFTAEDYLDGEYIFGTSTGLFGIGSTKSGGVLFPEEYYRALGEGGTFGDAWLAYWEFLHLVNFEVKDRDWNYGLVLLGDPLLVAQAYAAPEPGTGLVLLAGGALALARRRRRDQAGR